MNDKESQVALKTKEMHLLNKYFLCGSDLLRKTV